MSSNGNSPEPTSQPVALAVPISCHLLYEVSTTSQSKKKTKTTKKGSKVKQFMHSFSPTKSNYVELLNTMIVKHMSLKVKNKVSDERIFSCKIHVPPAKYIPELVYMRY